MLARVGRFIFHHQRGGRGGGARLFAVEQQGLTNGGSYGFRAERFSDEIGGLRPFAGKQPLGECSDEDHRHVHQRQYVFHCINSARPVGKADIGQDQFGMGAGGHGDRFAAGACNACDIVTEILND